MPKGIPLTVEQVTAIRDDLLKIHELAMAVFDDLDGGELTIGNADQLLELNKLVVTIRNLFAVVAAQHLADLGVRLPAGVHRRG